MHCSTRSRTKTRKKRNSWCHVRRNPIPNRKHARTGTEMNDMKRVLPSLILAVSVCTGCRTGTVRPERSEAPEIAAATAQPPPESVAGQLDIGRTVDVSKAMGTAPPSPQSVTGSSDIGGAMTSDAASIFNPINNVPLTPSQTTLNFGAWGTGSPTATITKLDTLLNPMNNVPLTPTQPTIDFGDWVRAEE